MDRVSSTALSHGDGVFVFKHSMSHPSHPRICVRIICCVIITIGRTIMNIPSSAFCKDTSIIRGHNFFYRKKRAFQIRRGTFPPLVANDRCFRHLVTLCSSGVRIFLETLMGAACFARMRFRLDDRHAHPVMLRNTTRPISR